MLPEGFPLAFEELLQLAQREPACRRQVEGLRHVLPLHLDVGDCVGDFICHRHWVHVHSTPGIRLFIYLVRAEASTATLSAPNRHEARTVAGMFHFDPPGLPSWVIMAPIARAAFPRRPVCMYASVQIGRMQRG